MFVAIRNDYGTLPEVVGPFENPTDAWSWIEHSGQPHNPGDWAVKEITPPYTID